MGKPGTREEMILWMLWAGIQEGDNLHGIIVNNGWADTEDEAEMWLRSLDITPWDD